MRRIFTRIFLMLFCIVFMLSAVGCGLLPFPLPGIGTTTAQVTTTVSPQTTVPPVTTVPPQTTVPPITTAPITPEDPDGPPVYDYDAIIKELALAYDRQGAQIPYDQKNARRSIFSSPEDATAQRTIFLDCSSFVNSIYQEGFGTAILLGKSPSTVNYDDYAKNNPDNEDVIGYWVPADYPTYEEKAAVAEWIYENLQVGDVLTYRHGTTSNVRGHCYIYIGNDTFMHCAGAGSYIVNASNPALSYDAVASEIATKGTIATIDSASIFETPENARYIFKATDTDTVFSFGILRPLARGLTPTSETLCRMEIAGLSMEKTASVCENAALDKGSLLTYTVTLENTNSYALTGVTVADVLPVGTAFVSADTGVSYGGGEIFWIGDVPASSTVTVSYSVRITAEKAGDLIVSGETYVSGVQLGRITHSVSGYSETQRTIISELARLYVSRGEEFTDTIEMVKALYADLGVELFDETTASAILDQCIDTENRTSHTETALSHIIAPNLYGGLDIRYGWLYLPEENDKVRLPKEENLSVGDILVADWSGGSHVYLYVGDHTLLTVKNGLCTALTIGDDIYTPGDNIIISLLGYDRYAVLRPSMQGPSPEIEITSITVTEPPLKLSYLDGEQFDPTGMTVTATLSNGASLPLTVYELSHGVLTADVDAVTVSVGDLSTSVLVSVSDKKYVASVEKASSLAVGESVLVEGIVIGVAHEGKSNDAEMLIKDLSSDTVIAVRNIPYGNFPNYGYEVGDCIQFQATVAKDISASTHYTLKKYLSFSGENGSIGETIVSKGNEVTFLLDTVTTLDSWQDMKSFFAKNKITPYTYVKISAGSFLNGYAGVDTYNYRLHKNASATAVSDIKADGISITLRDDVMTKNLGSGWTSLLFEERVDGYPGTPVEKEFYALYIGGNNSYYQLVILDADWIASTSTES